MVPQYTDMMRRFSLADANQGEVITGYTDKAVAQINSGDFTGAFHTWCETRYGPN